MVSFRKSIWENGSSPSFQGLFEVRIGHDSLIRAPHFELSRLESMRTDRAVADKGIEHVSMSHLFGPRFIHQFLVLGAQNTFCLMPRISSVFLSATVRCSEHGPSGLEGRWNGLTLKL